MSDYRYPEHRDPQVRPRYLGLPTFFRAPYKEDLSQIDIGLVGVPFDFGVTNRPGTRHGPREIRNQSSLIRKMNQATGVHPWKLARVADIGDAWAEMPFSLEKALAEIEQHFERVLDPKRTVQIGIRGSLSTPDFWKFSHDSGMRVVYMEELFKRGGRRGSPANRRCGSYLHQLRCRWAGSRLCARHRDSRGGRLLND